MAPRFSVLLPTRNRASLLRPAISSVLSQTRRDFELLVVGDGCTDDTAAVVAGFGDDRIRWLDLPKAYGFGYANRNVVLKQATGEYLAFVADDDLVFPDHLAQLEATLEASGAEWAYSRPLWVTTDGVVVPFASNLLNPDELQTFLTVGNHIPASCIVYRRRCLDAYGYWPEDVASAGDWQYWKRIIKGGRNTNIACSPTPTALHFNALWKTTEESQLMEVKAAHALAINGVWWPDSLRVPIAPGVPEQLVFFDLIGREDYVDRLRRDVARVVDRLAWIQLTETPALEYRLRHEIIRANTEVARLSAEAAAVRQELAHATTRWAEAQGQLAIALGSLSWRVTSPLRAVSRVIRQKGRALIRPRPS